MFTIILYVVWFLRKAFKPKCTHFTTCTCITVIFTVRNVRWKLRDALGNGVVKVKISKLNRESFKDALWYL